MEQTNPAQVIEYAIKESRRLTVKASGYFSRERICIDKILHVYFDNLGLSNLFNQISYCLHELAGNANKANTKRVYFEEKGLNIHDQKDYVEGMRTFKEETVDDIERYHRLQKEQNLWIKFHFDLGEETFDIKIRNNSPLTLEETGRIQSKFESAEQFDTVADAYSAIEDSSEGAGLGIVMMILMLRNLGFGDDALRIHSNDDETEAVLHLDLEPLHHCL